MDDQLYISSLLNILATYLGQDNPNESLSKYVIRETGGPYYMFSVQTGPIEFYASYDISDFSVARVTVIDPAVFSPPRAIHIETHIDCYSVEDKLYCITDDPEEQILIKLQGSSILDKRLKQSYEKLMEIVTGLIVHDLD